jgi:hypothetical protein
MRINLLLAANFGLLLLGSTFIQARNLGQWVDTSPEIRQWFESLVQPDTAGKGDESCCGEADSYYADETRYWGDKIVAVITDDRPDAPLKRLHEKVGTEYVVPANKIIGQEQLAKGNPTGHVLIFLGRSAWKTSSPRSVLCYVMNGGG